MCREGKGPREWAEHQLKYICQYTFYRTRREIAEAYASAGFNIKNIEEDYLGFRMMPLAKVFSMASFFARPLSRALGAQVIEATKKKIMSDISILQVIQLRYLLT